MSTVTRGYERDELAQLSRRALDTVARIVDAKLAPEQKLAQLDEAFAAADRVTRIAMREAAFMRICGVLR